MERLKCSYLGSGGVLADPVFFYVPHLEKKGYAQKNRLNGNVFTYDANGNIETQVRHDQNGQAIDNLVYKYHDISGKRKRNRLYHVNDAVSEGSYNDDIDQQSSDFTEPDNSIPNGSFVEADKVNSVGQHFNINEANNYVYDAEGRLIQDKQEQLKITWRVDGKIKEIRNLTGVLKVRFEYNGTGQRVAKHAYTGGILNKTTYYLYDATGNVMNVYQYVINNTDYTTSYSLIERHIYGEERIGLLNHKVTNFSTVSNTFYEGDKSFQMASHTGNILSVVQDKRKPLSIGGITVSGHEAYIASATDYSPFGNPLDLRSFQSANYRYGYGGMQRDDEIKGEGNTLDFVVRSYDPRLGRFFIIDRKAMSLPDFSPYQFCRNNPVLLKENGSDGIIPRWIWHTMGLTNPSAAMAAGFINAAVDDGKAIVNVAHFITSWDPTGFYYYTPAASQVRTETYETGKAVLQVMSNPVLQGIVISQAMEDIKNTVANADGADWAYAAGYASWQVVTLLIGVGEAKALMKGAQVSADLMKMIHGFGKVEKIVETLADGVKTERKLSGFSEKIAVIGRDMEGNVGVAKDALTKKLGKDVETFKASEGAENEWGDLLKEHKGNVPHDIVKSSKIYQENKTWAQKLKSEGYTVYDAGLGKMDRKGSFYSMETQVIFGDKK